MKGGRVKLFVSSNNIFSSFFLGKCKEMLGGQVGELREAGVLRGRNFGLYSKQDVV